MSNSEEALARRLDLVESKQQIIEILYRYARGWDRLDEEALRSCFWPDSMHEHSAYQGRSMDFISRHLPHIASIVSTMHRISNAIVVVDGDRATSECCFASHHRREAADGSGEEDFFLWGRYLDRLERRDGEWRIAYRRGLNETERVEPRADPNLSKAPPSQKGGRKPGDPLYQMLDDFRAGR